MRIAEGTSNFGRSIWWLVGAVILGLVLPAAAAAVPAILSFYPIGNFLVAPEPGLGTAIQAIIIAAIVLLVTSVIGAVYLRSMRSVVLALVSAVCMAIGTLPGLFTYYAVQDFGYYLVTPRSAELIDAIASYEKLHGKPPARLDDLVPDLLAVVPDTGMSVFPSYQYWASTGLCDLHNKWFLLIPLRGAFTDERLYYCPLRDYDLEPIESDLRSTEYRRIGDWVYSYTDIDD